MRIASQILYGRLGLATAGGLFCVLLGALRLIAPLDNVAYDAANKLLPLPVAEDVLIVAIDERSLLELGRWPWPRERHVELLRQLRKAGVQTIAVDIIFAEPDIEYPEVDQLLAEEIGEHGSVVLPVFIGKADRGGQLLEIEPIPPLASKAARLGHVHIEVDDDGVARRLYLKEGLVTPHWEHFSVALARELSQHPEPLPGLSDMRITDQSSAVSIVRSLENLIPFMGPAGTVDMVSYVDVIKGRIPQRVLAEKIVLVGATASGHGDKISTSLGQISGVEINANIFHALRLGKLAQRLSDAIAVALHFGLTFLTILFFTRLAPRALLAAVLLTVLAVPIASAMALKFQQVWFSPAPVMLTVLLAYPLWNWLRLDAAVDFMREQIKLLEAENRKSHFRWTWEHLAGAADFLKALGRVERWSLERDSARPAGTPRSKNWQHSGHSSSKYFTLSGESGLLTLYWRSGYPSPQENLDLIFPDTFEDNVDSNPGGDLIDIDIAQLEFAQKQARHNRELVSSTLAQLPNGIIVADSSGDIRLLNDQARHLLALQSERGKLLDALIRLEFPAGTEVREMISALALQGIAFNQEGRTLDGGRELLCRGRLIRLDRPMLLVSLTDVTDLKASENSRAEALNFLSHDLRAPLTSVLALIEGAKSEHPDQLNLELLDNIERYVQNNLAYAENFTQLARLEQTELAKRDETDAQSLIDNAVALVFHAAGKRHIRLRLETSEEDIWVRCNRGVLERAILNLLDNALKHSHEESEVIINLSCDDTDAIIRVVDQGSGIASDDIERIFDSFQQGASPVAGVGLGLRFVAAAAHSHNGSIHVESVPGRGSVFTLKFPRLPAEAAV